MRFESPLLLFVLFLIPILVAYRVYWGGRKRSALRFSSLAAVRAAGQSGTVILRHVPAVLRMLAIALIVLALARPQSYIELRKSYVEGVDIVLAMDVSTSMRAEDLERGRNRLDAAKDVVKWFLDKRESDRIGMVVFSAVAFTQCPLTLDYALVKQYIDNLKTGMIEDGTAIGNALASAVNRLRKSQAKSKVVVLLTDGMNNRGEIDPLTAAQMAKDYGIRVHTIGVGTIGRAPYPVKDMFGRTSYQMIDVEIDEELLEEISTNTGGRYYRATDKKELEKIFGEIDRLEKTKVESHGERRYTELFMFLLVPALFLVFMEILLSLTWLRTLP